MPAFLEKKLRAEGRKEGKTGKALDRYVYGAMNNMGAMHGNKETAKGRAMAAAHKRHGSPHEATHGPGTLGPKRKHT